MLISEINVGDKRKSVFFRCICLDFRFSPVMMNKIYALAATLAFCLIGNQALKAQDAIVQEGEFGIGLGAGHYFGDLNTTAQLNRPKMAATVFSEKL
ncbi:MAG: hypothetical protein NVV59_03485 [Chitinophagaceae bacterium]|nr:hypothetical protein [Chitinophagaceae bacterium]